MRSPVLFLLFNRPETTSRVFEAIREARPPRLYIAADGPRPGKPGEGELCEEARSVARKVDWPCEVKTLFRKRNLGCATGVSSAINWFFSQEEEGIILEDDVLPHQDFFYFCDTLLDYYRDDPRVMHISGNNFQLGLRRGDGSYYFSAFPHIWGWATWARAWKQYDISMPGVMNYIKNELATVAREPAGFAFFDVHIKKMLRGESNAWSFPWNYSVFRGKGLCINPNVPLVRNIGFSGGTNFTGAGCIWESLAAHPVGEIIHPSIMDIDKDADDYTCRAVFRLDGNGFVILAQECLNRIETGNAYANTELLRIMRSFYGESIHLDYLDVLSTAALGDAERALEKAEAIIRNSPEAINIKTLYARIRFLAFKGVSFRQDKKIA